MPLTALITVLISLATPVAGEPVTVQCAEMGHVGQAIPWETPARIVLSPATCEAIGQVVYHQVSPEQVPSLRALLHEAGHVAQWRLGLTNFSQPATSGFNYEHDAECRSLAALPRALYELGYFSEFINKAMWYETRDVEGGPAPYGGSCPAVAPWPEERLEHALDGLGQRRHCHLAKQEVEPVQRLLRGGRARAWPGGLLPRVDSSGIRPHSQRLA